MWMSKNDSSTLCLNAFLIVKGRKNIKNIQILADEALDRSMLAMKSVPSAQ